MKNYLFIFTALILITGTSCQKNVDIEKEKQAIMDVIKAESETARIGDVDGLKSCYLQDEYNTRLYFSNEGYKIITGWDKLNPWLDQLKENATSDSSKMSFKKENPVIKITGNTAWLICDNNWKWADDAGEYEYPGIQITFLEKVDGLWKFSFAAWIPKTEPEDTEESKAE